MRNRDLAFHAKMSILVPAYLSAYNVELAIIEENIQYPTKHLIKAAHPEYSERLVSFDSR